MKYGLEQVADSEVNEYFVGKLSEIYSADSHLFYETELKSVGSRVAEYRRRDIPILEIERLSKNYIENKRINKNYIENTKNMGFLRKLFNFLFLIEPKEKIDYQFTSMNHRKVESFIENYFEKNSDIRECELGIINILGSDFLFSLTNLSETDYFLDPYTVGTGFAADPNDRDAIIDYMGGVDSYTIYGKATGKLYKFNLRFTLKD